MTGIIIVNRITNFFIIASSYDPHKSKFKRSEIY